MRQRGFTLLETIVSASILALVMLALLALISTTNRTTYKAELRAKATTLSENLLERMRRRAYADLEPGTMSFTVDNTVWELPNLEAQAEITEVPGFDGRLKEIDLVVRWSELGRPAQLRQTVRLSALRR